MENIEQNIAAISKSYDKEVTINVSFDHLERDFDTNSRLLILYSKVNYKNDSFEWDGTVQTVKIPYNDPSLGFLVNGANRSLVSNYSRASGPVYNKDYKDGQKKTPALELITYTNNTLYLMVSRGKLMVRINKNDKIPVGVFLKAISNLPYSLIKKKIAMMTPETANSFIMNSNGEEMSIEECVNEVYKALNSSKRKNGMSVDQVENDTLDFSKMSQYQRYIKLRMMGLSYKNVDRIEMKQSVGYRAVGSILRKTINVPIFDKNGSVTSFTVKAGTLISDEIAKQIRRYDIDTLVVGRDKVVTLNDLSPMLFRIQGYQLGEDIGEYKKGTFITEDIMKNINKTSVLELKVLTPQGIKYVKRAGEEVGINDILTLINIFNTYPHLNQDYNSTQYSVDNRAIIDYSSTITKLITDTYTKIIEELYQLPLNLPEKDKLKNISFALEFLPNTELIKWFENNARKEVVQPDLTNLLARLTNSKKASANMQANAAVQKVQLGQYGRLDSLHCPESEKVGIVQNPTVFCNIDANTGEIRTKYEIVRDGMPTGEFEEISASKERNKAIAEWCDNLTGDIINVRINGDITTVPRLSVDYREVSPYFDMSMSRTMIPFPGFNQPKRAIMATNMQCQAIPLIHSQRAIINTGADTEIPCLYYTANDLLEMNEISKISGVNTIELVNMVFKEQTVVYTFKYGTEIFKHYSPCSVSDQQTLFLYELNKKANNIYEFNDVVIYYFSTDMQDYEINDYLEQGTMPYVKNPKRPALALGTNLLVCYKTEMSSTLDDGVVISSRLVEDDTLSNIKITTYEYELKAEEQFSDIGGVAPLHAHLSSGEVVISVIKKNGKLKEITADTPGEVIYRTVTNSKATVLTYTLHRACVGDKIAGRYGNKSVIARILPKDMMPYDPETGITVDLILSPLGIPSRMNNGQILEVAAAIATKTLNKNAVTSISPFNPNSKQIVTSMYSKAGLSPKKLYNPIYGKYTERPVMFGYMYILKLEQLAERKISATGYPISSDAVFGQPNTSGNQEKGQKIGEMETWVLEAAGLENTLDDFMTWYADDNKLRENIFNTFIDPVTGEWNESKDKTKAQMRNPNMNSLVFQSILRTYGLDLYCEDNNYRIVPIDLTKITDVVNQITLSTGRTSKDWSKLTLHHKIISPYWIDAANNIFSAIIGVDKANKILSSNYKVIEYDDGWAVYPYNEVVEGRSVYSGIDGLVFICEHSSIKKSIERLRSIISSTEDCGIEIKNALDICEWLDSKGYDLNIFVLDYYPVIPSIFRQSTMSVNGRESKHSFEKQLESIATATTSDDIYNNIRMFIGNDNMRDNGLTTIRNFFFGKGSDAHGKVRDAVLSKRVGFSGRSVIIPASDYTMPPFFLGVPWYIALKTYDKLIELRLKYVLTDIADELVRTCGYSTPDLITSLTSTKLKKIISSLWEFNYRILNEFVKTDKNTCMHFYFLLRRYIRGFIEGHVNDRGEVLYDGKWVAPENLAPNAVIDAAVVLHGRQPTLHTKSIRSFFIKLVDGYAINIHQLVCKGFNADFDGDQMYTVNTYGESKTEALQKIHCTNEIIAEKDGTFTIDLVQDACLGLYAMSSFADNEAKYNKSKSKVYAYDSIEKLNTDVTYGNIKYHDTIIFTDLKSKNVYLSLAGRILINSAFLYSFTNEEFKDENGIAKALGLDKSRFKALHIDGVIASSSKKLEGRSQFIKIGDILTECYTKKGAREAIISCQKLYEMSLIASDIIGVSFTLDDLTPPVDVSELMSKPKEVETELNTLYQLGWVEQEDKKSSINIEWQNVTNVTKNKIIDALDYNSNIYYMLNSGARGNASQIMQSIGFVGTIKKSSNEDINTPILHGYGSGLSAHDYFQTTYAARMGVTSTQMETRNAGYATRQGIYMTNGAQIEEDDCGIKNSLVDVVFNRNTLFDIDDEFKERLLTMYSYALPFVTKDFKITEETLTYIEEYHLEQIIALETNEELLNMELLEEAYLPVEYKTKDATMFYVDDKENKIDISGDDLFNTVILDGTEDYYIYCKMLDRNKLLTPQAYEFIMSRHIREINTQDYGIVHLQYAVTDLFKSLTSRKLAMALPALTNDGMLTDETYKIIEKYQLRYIPIRTLVTCKSKHDCCAKCFGFKVADVDFGKKGENIGIIAAHSMCESATQLVLDTNHRAGARDKDGDVETGLDVFRKMLSGKLVSMNAEDNLEQLATKSGYIMKYNTNSNMASIINENGKTLYEFKTNGRLAVPDGAYIKEGEVLISGVTNLNKYSSTDIFYSALLTRMLLIRKYYEIFDGNNIKINARNFEVLARAQTSLVYLISPEVNMPNKKEIGVELEDRTGKYMLSVSTQSDTILRYSGIGGLAFEDFNSIVTNGMCNPNLMTAVSCTSNILTGNEIGSTKITFNTSSGKKSSSKRYDSNITTVLTSPNVDTNNFDLFSEYLFSELNGSSSKLSEFSIDDSLVDISSVPEDIEETSEDIIPEVKEDKTDKKEPDTSNEYKRGEGIVLQRMSL